MITVRAVRGIGEVMEGDDLATLFSAACHLQDGDILVVTSKVVSKAEGRVATMGRDEAVELETDRDVAARGATRVVRNRLGLTMAAAGVDASNTKPGTVVLLPVDPDASARRIREGLPANVAVLVTDTAGRAWRNGQTDIAVGAAGLEVLHDHTGKVDAYGNELVVTAPAIADELAAAGDLVKGKLTGSPAAVVRGLGQLVLAPGEHGPGAASLVRDEGEDLFGYGTREAVMHAVLADESRGFGAPAPADVLVAALSRLAAATVEDGVLVRLDDPDPRSLGRLEARVLAAAHAHGWELAEETPGSLRLAPASP